MSKTITIMKSQLAKQGGAEKYARLLADALHKRGHQVRVLTTGPCPDDVPYEVVSTTLKSKTSVSKVWEFEAFCEETLRNSPTDIILGLDRNRFQTHLRASSGVHKAYLGHRKAFESGWKNFRHILNPLHTTLLHIEKTGIENPDLKVLFTNSNMVKEEILTHFVIDEKKIEVVHNGVEWEALQESFDQWPAFHDNRRFELLFLGSDFARKGLTPLLHALAKLPSRDLHLSVVGHDKKEAKYKALAQKLGLKHKVTFYGSQSDIRPYLQKADCLVIPSHYDPFANVTVEALAMGLFVVSSKTNGGCEVLNSETGAIAEDLGHGLEVALLKAVHHPKTLERATMIRNSVRHLDLSTQLGAYLDKMEC